MARPVIRHAGPVKRVLVELEFQGRVVVYEMKPPDGSTFDVELRTGVRPTIDPVDIRWFMHPLADIGDVTMLSLNAECKAGQVIRREQPPTVACPRCGKAD